MIPGAITWKRGVQAAAAALVAVLLAAAPAAAAVFTQAEDIAIPDSGPATPYPSELLVSNQLGPVTDVDASIELTHGKPADLDILLVAPDGTAAVLMSDACTNPGFEGTMTFDQDAPNDVSQPGPCSSEPVRPKDYEASESWVFPPSLEGLDAFNGTNPSGRWFLYIDDDAAGGPGAVSEWSLDIEIGGAEIQLPGTYPAEVDVVADDTVITDLDVLLDGFSHNHPSDLDMFLESPTGQKVWLMSDVCGGNAQFIDFDLDIDDEAPNAFPESVPEQPMCNFSFRPMAYQSDTDNVFPAPAPAIPDPSAVSLSAFDLTDPDGTWRLWAADDEAEDEGFVVGGYDLQMTTRPAADVAFAVAAQVAPEGGSLIVDVVRSAGSAAMGRGSVVAATSSGTAQSGADFTPVSQTLTFEPGQTTKSIEVPIAADGPFEPEQDFSIVLGQHEGDAKPGTPAALGVTIPADAQQRPDDLPTGNEDKPAPRPFTPTNVLRSSSSARRCFRRGTRIQFRPRMPAGVAITRTEVYVNGRKIEDNVGVSAVAPINLTMSGRRLRVRIRVTSHDGRVVNIRRTFRRCKTRRKR